MNPKISKFLKAIGEKNYSTANDQLKEIVNEKHINRVKQAIIKHKNSK